MFMQFTTYFRIYQLTLRSVLCETLQKSGRENYVGANIRSVGTIVREVKERGNECPGSLNNV